MDVGMVDKIRVLPAEMCAVVRIVVDVENTR